MNCRPVYILVVGFIYFTRFYMFHVGLHVCNVIYCVNRAYYAVILMKSINQGYRRKVGSVPMAALRTGISDTIVPVDGSAVPCIRMTWR